MNHEIHEVHEKAETLAEIVAEMRGMGNYQQYSGDHARALADRIEAAWKRERAEIEANALAVGGVVEAARNKPSGNSAVMREALLKAIILLKVCDWPDDTPMQAVAEVIDEIEKASYAPPRNCDVGTAEEQAKRLREFCKKHRDGVRRCSRCPVERIFPKDCTLAWAQMPYEEGGAK